MARKPRQEKEQTSMAGVSHTKRPDRRHTRKRPGVTVESDQLHTELPEDRRAEIESLGITSENEPSHTEAAASDHTSRSDQDHTVLDVGSNTVRSDFGNTNEGMPGHTKPPDQSHTDREALEKTVTDIVRRELGKILQSEVAALPRGRGHEGKVTKRTFSIPESLWEEFRAAFPGEGMASAYVTRAIELYLKLKNGLAETNNP